MKRACGLLLAIWVVLAAVYGALAWSKLHSAAPSAIVAVLGGTFATMVVSSFIGIFTARRDKAALKRAEAGAPRQDGRLEAAAGPIRPLGEPLEAPFTGRKCVAYEYDVKNVGAQRSDFTGVALTPCVVDSPAGPAKVLGWAVLDEFGGGDPRAIDRERGLAYLKGTTFEKLGLTNVISTMGGLLADDDGSIKKDFRIEDAPIELGTNPVIEKIVPAGETVTVMGTWSEAKGGFATSQKALVRLFPGGVPTTTSRVSKSYAQTFGISLLFFLVLHAMLVPAYFLAPGPPKKDRQGNEIPKNPSVWDERDCERLKDLLAAGANPNEKAGGGRTPLMNAVANDNIECVKSLVAAGARPNDKDEDGSSAMSWAITGGKEEMVDVLKKAGGEDFRVTAENGRPLTEDDEPVKIVMQYDAAIQAGDLATLGKLSEPATAEMIKKADALQVWQHTRPKEPQFVEGYWNDTAATLTVKGKTFYPIVDDTVHYHLEKAFDGWHVRREWFFDKETGK